MSELTLTDDHLADKYTVAEYLERYLPETTVVPWDKIPHESTKAYRAFCVYRDGGRKRSYSYVRGRGVSMANSWPVDYMWTIRTRLYDEYVLAEEQIEQHKLKRETQKRHAEQAANALDGLMAPFKEYQRRIETNPGQLEEEMSALPTPKLLSTMQASGRVLQPLMNAERIAQDLPTEVVESHVQGQITVQDSPEALANVLGVLAESGVLDALIGTNPIIEVADTSDKQVGQDGPAPQAAGLPADTTS